MSRLVAVAAGVAALVLTGWMMEGAIAQDKKADKGPPQVTRKAIAENDKVKVYEVTYVPGAENKGIATSSTRVVRALKGGTVERRYSDGKTEKVVYKDGEVRINQPGPAFNSTNVGKSNIHFYVIELK